MGRPSLSKLNPRLHGPGHAGGTSRQQPIAKPKGRTLDDMVHGQRETARQPEAKEHHDRAIGANAPTAEPLLRDVKDDLVREVERVRQGGHPPQRSRMQVIKE